MREEDGRRRRLAAAGSFGREGDKVALKRALPERRVRTKRALGLFDALKHLASAERRFPERDTVKTRATAKAAKRAW